MSELVRYTWNEPGNVSKDAKYSVKVDGKGYAIGILYRTNDEEEWAMSTQGHPELVTLVNSVKERAQLIPGGAFYINEFKQVIVPAKVGTETLYYYAGEYAKDLSFEFEGKVVSGQPVDLEGNPVKPGDVWPGVHPGICYKLKAGAYDISFKRNIRPMVSKEERLSKYVGHEKARSVISKILTIKGFAGGRFYINEHRQMFTPIEGQYGYEYIYVGGLGESDPWFPKPEFS